MKKAVAILVMIMIAAGFDWSFSQIGGDIVKITLKNQFPVAVGFYINDKFVCNAAANASCSVRVNVNSAPFKIDAWGYDNRIIASRVFTSLERGKDIVWATGNVDLYAPAPQPAPPQPAPTKPVPSQTAPAPTQTVPTPASPISIDTTNITNIEVLDYQGQEIQNRAQMVSLANIERQKYLTGWTYDLSGEAGIRIGNNDKGAFYGVPPITVKRTAGDRLYGGEAGLNPWLAVVNNTLDGLVHKHMAAGGWEESIAFFLSEAFPHMIQIRFYAWPLPAPDNKWLLITADSGLISFLALDQKYQDALIYGRYRSALVYAPAENEFLQSAAAFTLYHGVDQFRIEQMQFAADAGGNQLHPVMDVGSYLDFKPEAPKITISGPFPSWCIQADKFFDVLHLAVVTAAEGSTNMLPMGTANLALLKLTHHLHPLVAKVLGPSDLEAFFGDWARLQNIINATIADSGAGGIFGSRGALIRDFTLNFVPTRIWPLSKFWNKPLYVAAKTMINNMPYDVHMINDPAHALPPKPGPAQPAPSPKPPPPAEVKKPSGKGLVLPAVLAGLGGAIYGAYKLGFLESDDWPDLRFGIVNNSQQTITSFIINGQECGPIAVAAGVYKEAPIFTIPHSGSCTTVNYSWRTSLNYTGSGSGKTNSGGVFSFETAWSGYYVYPNARPYFTEAIVACTSGRLYKRQD